VTSHVAVERRAHLDAEQARAVTDLAVAAGDSDGVFPLSEHVMLHLRHGGDVEATHLLVNHGPQLVGYAHLDATDAVDGASAELAVHPMFRRRGLGRALVEAAAVAAAESDPAGRLRLWAHGDHPSAAALAMSLGFERHRVLYLMRRSLALPFPAPEFPPGVALRAFRPGADDEAWVVVNARAFADHPDQGSWTVEDLRVRMAEPWFDPAGFLLAERDGRLLGFHWTKVHGLNSDGNHDHEPIGEVYVLGLDPDAQGLGLGAALTVAGLQHLRDRGLSEVMLYVDESNTRAVALYRRMGFRRWATDVSYRKTLSVTDSALAVTGP
jgi:mycothiol synthase